MAYRKRLIQIAGFSAVTGFAVLSQSGVAHAGHMHDSNSKGGDTMRSYGGGSHTDFLDKKYNAAGKGGSSLTSVGSIMNGGSYDKTTATGSIVNSKGGSSYDKTTAIGSIVNKGGYDKGGDHKDKGRGPDCGPKKAIHIEKPKKIEMPCPPKAEKPKKIEMPKKIEIPCKPEMPKMPKIDIPVVEKPVVVVVKEAPVAVKPEVIVLAAPEAPKPAPAVKSAELAKTGSETVPLAGLGIALVGLGIAMERAGKRNRRTVSVESNTEAWPKVVGA